MQHYSGVSSSCPEWQLKEYSRYIAEHPGAAYAEAYKHLKEVAKKKGINESYLHSESALRRTFKCYGADYETLIRKGPKAHFDKHGVTSPQIVLAPNSVWQCDCKALDIWVMDLITGKIFKPWVVTFLDTTSRLMMGWQVFAHEPVTRDIARTLKHALLSSKDKHWYGKPAVITTDNGSCFKRDYASILNALGIVHRPNKPRCAVMNGKLERLHRTYDEEFSKCFFDGVHKTIATKQEMRNSGFDTLWSRLPVSFATFARHYCLNRPHSQLPDKQTPFEFYNEHVDVKTLQHGLSDVEKKVVFTTEATVRKGYVVVEDRSYSSGKLVFHEGRTVTIQVPPEGATSWKVWAYYNNQAIDEEGLRCHEDDPGLAQELRAYSSGKMVDLKGVKNAMLGDRGPNARHEKNMEAAKARGEAPEEDPAKQAEAPKPEQKQASLKPANFTKLRKSTTK
jgi:transposase InsO family protein